MNQFFKVSALIVTISLSFASIGYAEIIDGIKVPVAECNENRPARFNNCICSTKTPKTIKYRPAMKECGRKAAVILSGKFKNSYSVVLRDRENRDRWPASGYNGCSAAEVEAGLSKCSAFKVQRRISTNSSSAHKGPQVIHCFGEKASSKIMQDATRMTIKLRDIPNSTEDPLLRVCLRNFNQNLKLN